MHQVTGVARTAYAENEELRLTIMHVAPALMSSDLALGPSRRLRNIFDRTFNSHEPYKEREYRVNEAGTVLIPRLRHSQSFNYAVGPRTGDSRRAAAYSVLRQVTELCNVHSR